VVFQEYIDTVLRTGRGEHVTPLRGAPWFDGCKVEVMPWRLDSEIAARPPGRCTGMHRLLDCLLDFASRNGPPARPPGPQATPRRGALRVHNLFTPMGFAWKTLSSFPHRPSQQSVHQQSFAYKKMKSATAALRWPLLHHLTGPRSSNAYERKSPVP
jgi:hypothetical protein